MLSYWGRSRLKIEMHLLDHKLFTTSLPSLAPLKLPSRIMSRETHFWYVLPHEVKSESLLRQYLDLLSPCEKEHVFSFSRDELRKSALLARALVRTTIARYQINSQVSPRSLMFKKNAHGKPEVLVQHHDDWHQLPLHFNLSHTSSLIACGVTADSPESYVKALGRGFSGAPFNTFNIRYKPATRGNFHLSDNSTSEVSEIVVEPLENLTTLTTNWQFALLELAGSHYAAICREKDCVSEGKGRDPMKLTVWKTFPLVEDICVSGTDSVGIIAGLV